MTKNWHRTFMVSLVLISTLPMSGCIFDIAFLLFLLEEQSRAEDELYCFERHLVFNGTHCVEPGSGSQGSPPPGPRPAPIASPRRGAPPPPREDKGSLIESPEWIEPESPGESTLDPLDLSPARLGLRSRRLPGLPVTCYADRPPVCKKNP